MGDGAVTIPAPRAETHQWHLRVLQVLTEGAEQSAAKATVALVAQRLSGPSLSTGRLASRALLSLPCAQGPVLVPAA